MAAGTTVPEPNTANGEVAWIASGSYPIDDLCTSNGSVYSCFRAHSGRTVRLEADPGYWLRKGPTDRMAPFDDYSATKSRGKGAITFVLTPGCVNGVSVYGPEGATYSLVVREAPGGRGDTGGGDPRRKRAQVHRPGQPGFAGRPGHPAGVPGTQLILLRSSTRRSSRTNCPAR